MRLLWALVLCLAPRQVHSQKTVTVVLRPGGLETHGRLVAEFTARLSQTEGVLALAPEPPIELETLREADGRAQMFLEEARERFRKFDEQGALARLEESREALPGRCGGADLALLRSQHLVEGLIHFMAGRREEAMLAFSLLAAMDPHWEPDAKELAPKIVALALLAREERLQRPRAMLEVDGTRGARVRMNGQEVGTIPTVQEAVPPGVHCLEVTSPNHGAWARQVTIPDGSTIRLRAVLFPDVARVLLEKKAADPGEVARAFGTAFLVVGDATTEEVSATLISAATGRESKPVVCTAPPSDDITALVSCLHGGILAALEAEPEVAAVRSVTEQPGALTQPAVEGEGEPAFYERWWFWTIVGSAVAVGVGVTLGVVLQPEASTSSDYGVIVTW
ncbi:PEGA domain-containing protein [Myxococcota bacterium]